MSMSDEKKGSWEPKKKIVSMSLATIVALAALGTAIFGPEDIRSAALGVCAAAVALLSVGSLRAAASVALICLLPLFAGCASLPSVERVEGDIAVVGEPEPSSAGMGVTLFLDNATVVGIGADISWAEGALDGSVCLEYYESDLTPLGLSVCVRCAEGEGCVVVSPEPESAVEEPGNV